MLTEEQKEKKKAYHREWMRNWYRNNREKALAQMKARREKNPELYRGFAKKHYYAKHEEHKTEMRAAHQKRWADPEKRQKILAENRERAKAHPEWGRKGALAWRHKNLELARKNCREWEKKNHAWRQAWDHEKRAKVKAVTINPKSIQLFIKGVRASKVVVCYYCEKPVSGKKAHIDHIIPLSKGGPHSVENLCVACPPCNQTKINKLIPEWIRLGQQILEL